LSHGVSVVLCLLAAAVSSDVRCWKDCAPAWLHQPHTDMHAAYSIACRCHAACNLLANRGQLPSTITPFLATTHACVQARAWCVRAVSRSCAWGSPSLESSSAPVAPGKGGTQLEARDDSSSLTDPWCSSRTCCYGKHGSGQLPPSRCLPQPIICRVVLCCAVLWHLLQGGLTAGCGPHQGQRPGSCRLLLEQTG
jgi:hypothetical protein